MQERLKELQKKFLEYWNKWTKKQKAIIIGSIAVVILMLVILVAVLGRTKYVELGKFDATKTASEVVSLLRENEITTKLSADNKTVMVDTEKYSDAIMIVSTSELTKDEFDIDDLLNTSITTTNREMTIRQHLRLESGMKEAFLRVEGVEDVQISYMPKDNSTSIRKDDNSTPISIILTTNGRYEKDSSVAIAKYAAYAIGNENTDLVKIIDTNGNVLFDGPDGENPDEIDLTDKTVMMEYFYDMYVEAITGAMIMNDFTEVNVVPQLHMNFDRVTELFTEYFPLEGEIHGVLYERHETSSSGEGGSGDVPGTDSNDEVDYYLDTTTGTVYESSTEDEYYQSSVSVKEIVYDVGTIDRDKSSISVVVKKILTVKEETLERLGALDDMSFEEYVDRHSEVVWIEPDEELIAVIANATGFSEEHITLRCGNVYNYVAKEEVTRDWTTYLQILLVVLLVGFLAFVIFRGMSPVEVTELEPELSVEQLLATTKENQSLEDVEFSEQSETRKMIEKFFEENPEAVAQLLRNWLNEEWE